MITPVTASPRRRRTYDPRLKLLVIEGGAAVARELGVPKSTASDWARNPPPDVVSADVIALPELELRKEVEKLERRVKLLVAIVVLLRALLAVSRFRLERSRITDPLFKIALLGAVERAVKAMPQRAVLRILGLGATRFHAWKKALDEDCPLDDLPNCPNTHPTQLTLDEVRTMKDMATSPDYRHVPTSVLAILAQRAGKVFASPATWCRYVRDRGWRRPRVRLHPSKPSEGVRSDKPDQLWHVDTTMLRLVDGRRVYLRAIIDNFSRKVLAWWAGANFDAGANAILLAKAAEAKNRPGGDDKPQSVMVDGGIENFNDAMAKLVGEGLLKLIHAQTDVLESNSMIERFWLSAKHGWLFLNNLDSLAAVVRLVEFYVTQHNSVLPHAALGGRTPDEVYFGTATEVPDQLKEARAKAREARIEANRARSRDD